MNHKRLFQNITQENTSTNQQLVVVSGEWNMAEANEERVEMMINRDEFNMRNEDELERNEE